MRTWEQQQKREADLARLTRVLVQLRKWADKRGLPFHSALGLSWETHRVERQRENKNG